MERRPWLERVAIELDRRRVPAGYRSRLLAELGDHIHDLTEEGAMSTDERLGDPEVVAAAAADQLRGGWVRRHPLLVFGLAPIPVAFGAMAGMLVGLGLFVWAADELTGWTTSAARPVVGRALVVGFDLAVRFGAALVMTALFARVAARSGFDRRWPAVAAVQLAAFAGCWVTHSQYSDAPNQSSLSIGFLPGDWFLSWYFSTREWDWTVKYLSLGHLFQTAVPLVVGVVLFARYRRTAGPVAAV